MEDPIKQTISYPRDVRTPEFGLYAWGWGDFGVLGNDGCRSELAPTKVHMGCITTPALHESSDMAVACGPSHTVATEAGSCFMWGKRFGGKKLQLSAVHVVEGDLDKAYVVDIAAGKECAFAVGGICPADGEALQRALRWEARLAELVRLWPRSAVVNTGVDIVARQVRRLRQKVNAQRLFDGVVFSWGVGGRGQLGRGDDVVASEHPAAVRDGALALEMSSDDADTEAFNEEAFFKSVADSASQTRAASKEAPRALRCPHRITQLAAGRAHVLALSVDGAVLSWGDDAWGQLGLGAHIPEAWETAEMRTVPTRVKFPSSMPIRSIAAGESHSLAVPAAGRRGVFAWGCGRDGQLGMGSRKSRSRPTLVPDLLLKRMLCAAGGKAHTLFISAPEPAAAGQPPSNALWVCGIGAYGQLGLGDELPTMLKTPRRVGDINKLLRHGEWLSAASAGDRHSLATTSEGGIIAWGWGNWGEAGLMDCTLRSYPWRLPGFGETARERKTFGRGARSAVAVACGARHSACVAYRDVKRLAHKRAHTIEVVSAQIARGEHRTGKLSWKKEAAGAGAEAKAAAAVDAAAAGASAKLATELAAAKASARAPLCVCVLHSTSATVGWKGHLTLSCPAKGYDVVCAECAQRYLGDDDDVEVVVSDTDTVCNLGIETALRAASLEMLSVAENEHTGELLAAASDARSVAPTLAPPRATAAEFAGHATAHHSASRRLSFRKKPRALRDPKARAFWDAHRIEAAEREAEERAAAATAAAAVAEDADAF